ncbi:thiamine pyrophosphate-dependent dehydrogenase E1 component subunit alpha [Micromonospora sp. NPDC048830]|uniref:thiamine pyrophosphate-dependent dehydrogenase E1 component subunit alpha n=1 Tax=Micromonospora sp. NPDC048830 TaxID=3364257 RepID=UPI0037147DE9
MSDAQIKELSLALGAIWRIRMFEEEVTRLRLAGDVVGSVHLCNGQEAIAVGTCAELNLPTDRVFATYRGHGWALACGVPLHPLFSELLGRETGINGGRGGSAYFSASRYGFMGENSIVGAGAPIAAGAAMAGRFDGTDRVIVSVFGDGAMNQGAVHEAMNFAAALSLPVIFLVENNLYSEMTPIRDTTRDAELYKRAQAYAMAGWRFDGNDVSEVRRNVAAAIARCREGRGPVLLEAMTQRLVGHYIGDAQLYRPAGEVDRIQEFEPVRVIERQLLALGAPAQLASDVHTQAQVDVSAAVGAAMADPPADATLLKEHLYA